MNDKKYNPTIWQGREGATLCALLISTCVIGGTMVIGGIAATAYNWNRSVRNLSDRARAQAIAEAGVMEGYASLSRDLNRAFDPHAFQTVSFAGGTYRNHVAVMGEKDDYFLVSSRGTFQKEQVTVAVVFHDSGISTDESGHDPTSGTFEDDDIPVISGPGPASPFKYAVIVGGTVNWGGTAGGGAPGAWVHGNQEVSLYGNGHATASISSSERIFVQGNAPREYIDGNVFAPVITAGRPAHISGDRNVEAVAPIPIPQINFEPYRAWAQAHGEFFQHHHHISGDYEPSGGVLFVEGDLHLNGGNLKGCFVATGDIHVNAQVRHTTIAGLPGLMTDTGSLKINGGAEVQGLMYARTGNFDRLNGNAKLRGSIIAGGFMETNGTFDFEFVESTPQPPWQDNENGGGGGEWSSPVDENYEPSPAILYLSAWQG